MRLAHYFGTWNRGAINTNETKASGRPGYGKASRVEARTCPDEMVMNCMRRYLDGEPIARIAESVGHGYSTVHKWCVGEQKHVLYAKVMKERGL